MENEVRRESVGREERGRRQRETEREMVLSMPFSLKWNRRLSPLIRNITLGASEVAQQVKGLASKSDDLS